MGRPIRSLGAHGVSDLHIQHVARYQHDLEIIRVVHYMWISVPNRDYD